MLEIIGVFLLTRRVGRILSAKGYSRWMAAFVPMAWFGTELVVATIVLTYVPDIELISLALVALAAGASGGAVSYVVINGLEPKSVSAVAAVPPPAAPPAPKQSASVRSGRQALLGYCQECDKNVWLTPEGGCENGHGQDSISGVHWALR